MGGVARILNTLLKSLDKERYEIDLLVLHKRGELLKEIPEGIKVLSGSSFFETCDIPLKQCRGLQLFSKLRLLFYMKTGLIERKIAKERKKLLSKHYDIEFSAKEGFCTIFTACGDSKRKYNWVQVDYQESNYSANHMALMKRILKRIDLNIACSQQVKKSYQELFGVERICVIHNLIDEERIRRLSLANASIKPAKERINLITVARFHPQKAVDRLIRIIAKLKDYYHLVIIGDGQLRSEYQQLAKDLGCFADIEWLGMRQNPYPEVRVSDLFVMSSLYEGYPTMTIESLISSTPVLTTDVAGVREQIDEKTGWIVDNSEEALLAKLIELKNEKELLTKMKTALQNYHYDNQAILDRYDAIFDDQSKR